MLIGQTRVIPSKFYIKSLQWEVLVSHYNTTSAIAINMAKSHLFNSRLRRRTLTIGEDGMLCSEPHIAVAKTNEQIGIALNYGGLWASLLSYSA